MPTTRRVCAALLGVVLAGPSSPALAQLYESAGIRAQGMAGAFVAVADDATATWWNPAGLATGALASLVVEQVRLREPPNPTPEEAGWRSRSRGFAIAYPALGLSHYRLRLSEIEPAQPIAGDPPDRQEGETLPGVPVRSLVANQFGITVGQSVGDHLVVATTLNLIRGGMVSSEAADVDALDRAEGVDVPLHTRTDLDLGLMASVGRARVGFSIRHLRRPTFGSGVDRLALGRQARMGIAVPGERVTMALDADLTRTRTATGDVRRVAGGVEAWLLNRRLGVRGGIGGNTTGARGASASAGLSVGVQRGVYLDAAVTAGSEQALAGWAIGLGLTY